MSDCRYHTPGIIPHTCLPHTRLAPWLQIMACLTTPLPHPLTANSSPLPPLPLPLDCPLNTVSIAVPCLPHIGSPLTCRHFRRWRERSFVKVPVADLMYSSQQDETAPTDPLSVLPGLREVHRACLAKDAEGRSSQPGLTSPLAGCSSSSSSGLAGGGEPLGQGDVMRRVTPLARGGRLLSWGRKTHVMGILNATPDSFSDGGRLFGGAAGSGEASAAELSTGSASSGLDVALGIARGMVRDGANILDVGGQSTRPGSTRVPEQEEAARVVPLIRCGRAGSAGLYILGTGSSQGAESPYPRTL